jgi:PAS domain S-box-containing protein
MERRLKILHAEDDIRDAELISASLEYQGIVSDVRRVDTLDTFVQALDEERYDLIISDFTMPAFDGLRALKVAKEKSPDTPFIYVSGTIGEERAVEALRSGAIDYVLKDKLFKLGPAVEHALRESALRTQRHLAEEQLYKAHHQLQRVLAASPAVIYTKTLLADGMLKTTFVSENIETILGHDSELFLLSPGFWAECVHPSDVDAFLENCRMTPEKPLRTQVYRFRCADGKYRWLTDESRVISGDGEERPEVVGSIVDVSDQKALEALRWEGEQKFRTLAEKSPSLILIWRGAKGLYANDRSLEFLGIGRDQILSSPLNLLALVAEESRQAMKSALDTIDSGAEISALNVIFERTNGQRVYCIVAGTQIAYETVPASMILATNVSDLRTLHWEKDALQAQFQQAQKMEAVGRLSGGIAHDFNNMLMVILGYVDVIRTRVGSDSSVQRFLGEIKKAIDRAASLTQQLLIFSRKQILQLEVTSMRSIAEEAAGMIKRVIGDDIELSLKLEDGFDLAKVDRGQMTQVLLNLAVNSRDAMPNGGKLTIETRREESPRGVGAILMDVCDTGIGMDDETQSHIFEPFFTTKEPGKGTGLGLANVHGIVKQSGGTIACSSAVGKGTRFLIRLPAAEGPQTVSGEATRAHTETKGTGRILLVEDDANVRTITKMILEEAGYGVQVASNGEEALRIWATMGEEIDLVVSDIVMPAMRGTEMAQRIRQITPKTRFLLMSGYDDDGDPQSGPLDAFLQKPAAPEVLLSAVRKVLDG